MPVAQQGARPTRAGFALETYSFLVLNAAVESTILRVVMIVFPFAPSLALL